MDCPILSPEELNELWRRVAPRLLVEQPAEPECARPAKSCPLPALTLLAGIILLFLDR